jgi:4-amino-4-deoxy-L-arabinose transferase-like glycosyltransferase
LKKTHQSAQDQRFARQRNEARFTLLLGALSVAALLYYYAKQELLLYGDAVAHLNIARRVVDNRHPLQAYGQLGTVWLPLQHIAMLPFVWSDTLWRSGIAGAIPGMVAFILGTVAVYRLVSARADKIAAYAASGIYALNPNLLYMQTTAMNEPIFLAFFLWALVYLDEFARATFPPPAGSSVAPAQTSPRRALEACGIAMAGGAFTRYDGWFSGAIFGVILAYLFAVWWKRNPDTKRRRAMSKSFAEVLLLNALIPVHWLVYTYFISGRAFDFATGPYSAKAIALRSTAQGAPPYPGQHHILTAALYFLKAAQLNVGMGPWGKALFIVALFGTGLAAWRFHRYGVLLPLWLPLPFYALSIAYGSVPIYIPAWYPFSYYNVRYGLELLPVFAVFSAILAACLTAKLKAEAARIGVWCSLAVLVVVSYGSVYVVGPITLREAQVNSRGRVGLEQGMANFLATTPPSATLLMYEAEHPNALRMAGIPLRHVISESEHPEWEWALIDPARGADYIVACEGDPVWVAVRPHAKDLIELFSVSAPGQSRCVIYRPRNSNAPAPAT